MIDNLSPDFFQEKPLDTDLITNLTANLPEIVFASVSDPNNKELIGFANAFNALLFDHFSTATKIMQNFMHSKKFRDLVNVNIAKIDSVNLQFNAAKEYYQDLFDIQELPESPYALGVLKAIATFHRIITEKIDEKDLLDPIENDEPKNGYINMKSPKKETASTEQKIDFSSYLKKVDHTETHMTIDEFCTYLASLPSKGLTENFTIKSLHRDTIYTPWYTLHIHPKNDLTVLDFTIIATIISQCKSEIRVKFI